MTRDNRSDAYQSDFSFHNDSESKTLQISVKNKDVYAASVNSDVARTFDFSKELGLCETREVMIGHSPELLNLVWPKSAPTVTCLKIVNVRHLSHLDLSAFPNLELLSIMGCTGLSKISGIGAFLKTLNLYDVAINQIDLSHADQLQIFNVTTESPNFKIDLSYHDKLATFSLIMHKSESKQNQVDVNLAEAKLLRTCFIETPALAKVDVSGCHNLLYRHFVCGPESTITEDETEHMQVDPSKLKELSLMFHRDTKGFDSQRDEILTSIQQIAKGRSGEKVVLANIEFILALSHMRPEIQPMSESALEQVQTAIEKMEAESHPAHSDEQHPHFDPHLFHSHSTDHGGVHPRHMKESQEEQKETKEKEGEIKKERTEEPEDHHPHQQHDEHEPHKEHEELIEELIEDFDEEYDELLEREEEPFSEEAKSWLEECHDTILQVYETFWETLIHHHDLQHHTPETHSFLSHQAHLSNRPLLPNLRKIMLQVAKKTKPPRRSPLPKISIEDTPEPTVPVTVPRQEVVDNIVAKNPVREIVIDELVEQLHKPEERIEFTARTRCPQRHWDIVRYTENFYNDWRKEWMAAKEAFDAGTPDVPRYVPHAKVGDLESSARLKAGVLAPKIGIMKDVLDKLIGNHILKVSQGIDLFQKIKPLDVVRSNLKDLIKSEAFIKFLNEGVQKAQNYSLGEDGQYHQYLPGEGDKISRSYKDTIAQDINFQDYCKEMIDKDEDFTKLITKYANSTNPKLKLTEDGVFFLKLLTVLLVSKNPPQLAVLVRPERSRKEQRQQH